MDGHTPISIETARRLERSFEVLVYYVTALVVFSSYLPLGLPINHTLINIVAVITVIFAGISYRILPIEYHNGLINYTFELKSFVLIVCDIIFASLIVGATGGGDGPYIFLYAFLIMAATLMLHAIHIYILIPITMITLVMADYIAHPGSTLEPRILINVGMLILLYWLSIIIVKRKRGEWI